MTAGYGAAKFEWLKRAERLELTATQWQALIVVFNRWAPSGAIVSAEHIAESTGMSLRSAKYALARLRELDIVTQVAKGGRAGDGRKWASTYQLGDMSGCKALHVEMDVNVQDDVSQRASSRSQGASACTPIDQLPTDQLPIDQRASYVSNAGTRAGARATITDERLDPYVDTYDGMGTGIPKRAPLIDDPLAEYNHLLTPWSRKQLLARAQIDADDRYTPEQLAALIIRAYLSSPLPQTRSGMRTFVQEINSTTDADAGLPDPDTLRRLLGIEAA